MKNRKIVYFLLLIVLTGCTTGKNISNSKNSSEKYVESQKLESVITAEVPLQINEAGRYVTSVKWSDFPVDISVVVNDKVVGADNSELYATTDNRVFVTFDVPDMGAYNLQIHKTKSDVQDIKINTYKISDEWFLVKDASFKLDSSNNELVYNILSLKSFEGDVKIIFESLVDDEKRVEIKERFTEGINTIDLGEIPPGNYNAYAEFKSATYMDIYNLGDNVIIE